MPIQFRCQHCVQKLSISRRKAGIVVACPACGRELQVPTLEEAFLAGQLIESPAEEAEPDAQRQTLRAPEAVGVGEVEGSLPSAQLVTATGELTLHDDDEDEEDDGFKLQGRGFPEDELDMTPMVDVTFLLLIFFMITASFSLQKSMEAEAPAPEQEGAAQLPMLEDFADDSVIVEIDESNTIFVDDQPVSGWQELEDVLVRKINTEQKTEMVIEPHYRASHGTVVQVTDAGIHAGMQRIRRVSRSSE